MIRKYRKHTALKFANRVREREGYGSLAKLPVGRQGDELSCPLARAVPHSRVNGRALSTSYEYAVLPMRVQRFVRDFDRGKYPELIA